MSIYSRILLLAGFCLVPCLSFAQKHVITRPTTKPKTEQKTKPAAKPKKSSGRQPGRLQEPKGNYSREVLADETVTVGSVSFVMVGVQGGVFTMGGTPEQGPNYDTDETVHRVAVSSFRIGQTEVTQALWKTVMGDNPSYFKGDDELPVEQVSWDDCQTFISRLNRLTGRQFRLPTEAEWEFAARGGNKSRGYKYAGSDNIYNVAWYEDNSGGTTHPVRTKQPNELGLYDMSGNVYEWCQDWFGPYSVSGVTNPWGAESGKARINRGGQLGAQRLVCSCRLSQCH